MAHGAARTGQQTQRNDDSIAAALYALVSFGVRRRGRDTRLLTLATLDNLGPRRITDLAVIQGIAQPSMTAVVKELEKSGLVRRRHDSHDRRIALVGLTPAGARLLSTRREERLAEFTQVVDALTPAERETLAAAVPVLRRVHELQSRQVDPAAARDQPQITTD